MPDDPDGNLNILSWSDINCVDPANANVAQVFGAFCANAAPLKNVAHLGTTLTNTPAFGSAAGTSGPGFIFYLAGKFWIMNMAALPTAGTVWNARYVAGNITGTAGTYGFAEASSRPAAVPGLRAAICFTGSSAVDVKNTTDAQLSLVHTVPDPYYVTNSLEITPNNKVLKFVNLPATGDRPDLLGERHPGAGARPTTTRRAGASWTGICGTARTSSWRPACTSITSKPPMGKRRSAGSPSSNSRREESDHDHDTHRACSAR